jgi:hypothetical protein
MEQKFNLLNCNPWLTIPTHIALKHVYLLQLPYAFNLLVNNTYQSKVQWYVNKVPKHQFTLTL